jgi:flagellar assembly factor FliW
MVEYMHTQQQSFAVETSRLSGSRVMTYEPLKEQPNAPGDASSLVIQSRFGEVTVRKDNALFFPQGLLGLPPKLHFAIVDIPQKNMGQFKLLQCLSDHSLSFIVLPVDIDNIIIARADLAETCSVLNVKEENLLTLLIVSVQRTPEGSKVTANARAPIIVDVSDRAAIQFVFPHSKYQISHPLTK